VFGIGAYYVSARSSAPTTTSSTAPARPGANVDGISCQAEMLNYHIHVALMLYQNGRQVTLPTGIGHAVLNQQNTCLYWLHTHDFDHAQGIVHIESPTQQIYTLGQFLDLWRYSSIWGAWSDAGRIITVDGSFVNALRSAKPNNVHVYVNGKAARSYNSIPLTAHDVITIELGAPLIKPTTSVTFPAGE